MYNNLRNSVKRHINEEKIMYSEFEPTDKKTLDILDKIRGDHRKIKSLIEDSFEDDDDEFIKTSEILKKLFLNHKKIKEEKLYLH